MSYVGMRLAPMFDRSGVDRLCRDIAERGGERMTDWTIRNTPVAHRPFDESYVPGALRASIHKKVLIVTVTRGGLVYESGVETDLKYAPYVEHGTGLYHTMEVGDDFEVPDPHSEWIITPKRPDGWLSWIDQETGQRHFAKSVRQKGAHGQHMFAIGAHMTEAEFHVFADRLVQAWARRQERKLEEQVPVFVGKRL